MSVSLISKINELVKDPQCIYQALESILPHCSTPANTIERQRLAVKLTVCDYTAAGLELPLACSDDTQFHQCVHYLESRAQWWTSYTANYQTIGQVCVEFQPEFEAQNAAQLYRNMSILTQSYLTDLHDSYSDLSTVYDAVQAQSTALTNMELALQDIRAQVSALTSDLANSGQAAAGVEIRLSSLGAQTSQLMTLESQLMQQIATTVYDMDLLYEKIGVQFAGISTNLGLIASSSVYIQELQNSTLSSALDASEIARNTVQELKVHAGAMLDLLARLGIFFQILGNLWCVGGTIVIIIILKKASWPATDTNLFPEGSSNTASKVATGLPALFY